VRPTSEMTVRMLDVYRQVVEDVMAIPVICGEKPESERFPGADRTLTIEAMMQDGKALQAGTSHFLGQNFARAVGIRFQDRSGESRYCWTTSWGISTRLIGARIRAQSWGGATIRCHVDEREIAAPDKRWEWIKKGVPVLCEVGPRDLQQGTVACSVRHELAFDSGVHLPHGKDGRSPSLRVGCSMKLSRGTICDSGHRR
jgi:prolyl-tRNA synthetase